MPAQYMAAAAAAVLTYDISAALGCPVVEHPQVLQHLHSSAAAATQAAPAAAQSQVWALLASHAKPTSVHCITGHSKSCRRPRTQLRCGVHAHWQSRHSQQQLPNATSSGKTAFQCTFTAANSKCTPAAVPPCSGW
jgi:hypothetical protein